MTQLKSITRNLMKFKYYSFINLFGLVLGLTCSVALFLYVSHESSFDQFHADKDRIFRINEISHSPNTKDLFPLVRIPVGPDMKEVISEIQDFTRLLPGSQSMLIKYDEKIISIHQPLYADANFFQFFSFGLKTGNPSQVLNNDNSIVLTEDVASRLFGEQNPIGAMVFCNNQSFVVNGIANEVPLNSHIAFDAVFSIEPRIKTPGVYIAWDGGMSAATFIKLYDANQIADVTGRLPDFLWEKVNKDDHGSGFFTEFEMEPLTRIHLHSKVDWDPFPKKLLSI
jgi:putative ABC transport system permease protein